MANVTYLLGAGASANCLPTYLNFENRFSKFRNLFLENLTSIKNLDESQKEDAANIKKIADDIAQEFRFHNTPDTIAKKYFHSRKGSSDLANLKNILILFFLYEQTLNHTSINKESGDPEFKHPIDKRYDAFIASLLKPIEGKLQLYDQFKILTWNYDSQFEIAYSKYNNNIFIPRCQRLIQSWPTLLPDGSEKFTIDKFSITHLNGIAYARADSSRGNKDILGDFFETHLPPIEHLINIYRSMITRGIPGDIGGSKLLSFAWEKQSENNGISDDGILKKAIEVARQTQILVIIGYSFPIFNNPIDKLIFKEMNQLRNVYIQSPNGKDIKNILLYELLDSISEDKIKDLDYWNQFYIPLEWNKLYGTKV